jgi:hypothetical protein
MLQCGRKPPHVIAAAQTETGRVHAKQREAHYYRRC